MPPLPLDFSYGDIFVCFIFASISPFSENCLQSISFRFESFHVELHFSFHIRLLSFLLRITFLSLFHVQFHFICQRRISVVKENHFTMSNFYILFSFSSNLSDFSEISFKSIYEKTRVFCQRKTEVFYSANRFFINRKLANLQTIHYRSNYVNNGTRLVF
jgi:hypothetical protein